MIEKIDVGRAAGEPFVFDQVVFKEGFDRISLLNDKQLKERMTTSAIRILFAFDTYFHVTVAFVAHVS